ncbi:MAG TPA: cation diffusion facilitator family transporter [Candidatus Polarisedimenticolia bacterium]|jgi:cation diffusion facilitator family transporter
MTPGASSVRRVLWVTLGLNFAVAFAKIICGVLTHTLSMIADGYHSMFDGISNIVGLVALGAAHRPPDEDHHYGHRKFEVLATILISVMLFIAAAEILASSWGRLRGGGTLAVFSPAGVAIMLVTMVINLSVSRYEGRRGRELGSPFLVADSRHTASDVYVSASVLAAIFSVKMGLGWLDPVAAVVIGGVIIYTGYALLRGSLGVLADRARIDAKAIETIALEFPDVRGCRQIRSRGLADSVYVDLTVRLDPTLTLREAHDICDRLEARLKRAHPIITDIIVHPEPEEEDRPDILTRSP